MSYRSTVPRLRVPPRAEVVRSAAAVAAVALLTAALAPVRTHLALLNAALLYLLLTVVIAARWGWWPSLVASVAANLTFNFFFVPPLYRFTVQQPENVLALLVFLVVAGVTSWLLARARSGEAAAQRRVQETSILYDLSRLIIAETDATNAIGAICERVGETFTVESCAVLLPTGGALSPIVERGGAATHSPTAYERRAADDALATGHTVLIGGAGGRRQPRIVGREDRRVPSVALPLCIGGRVVGVMLVVGKRAARVFTEDESRLLEAFADVAALAVDRDRLRHEAARAEALQETDRLKSAVLSAVSHDLRTPLASIKASASSLLQSDVEWDAATRREFLTAIDEETDRLTRLVSNLLDLSRIEGGALRPETDWYDVGELLQTVADRIRRTLTTHRLALTIAPDVGSAPLDYVQIGQVLTNLIENAAKFAPAGSEIRVEAARRDGLIELAVSDHGPGIALEERERVFQKFYRVQRGGMHVPGTGLGLAISKGLVEAHGGHIRITDAVGGGARVVVTLLAPAAPPSVLAGLDTR